MVKARSKILDLLQTICDPEIPVISVIELGILKAINISENSLEIVITPTYGACPAMNFFKADIIAVLQENGFQNVSVRIDLSPPWSSDMITEIGQQKLLKYGIAPPSKQKCNTGETIVACPRCKSQDTTCIAEFGSTACKSLYKCNDCLEPFDYFKCY